MENFIISKEFLDGVRTLLYQKTGIHLDFTKDMLIKNRIRKLTREVDITDPEVFLKEIARGKNEQEFINAFTTNKTDFFRENFHFLDLIDRVMPRFCVKNSGIKILCSASSTGEEPYSIAVALLHAKELYGLSCFPVSIIATDIDTEALKVAQNGVYDINTKISPLPTWIDLERYFHIKDLGNNHVHLEAKEQIKSLITFKKLNLFADTYPFMAEEFDIIFCRNVLIYFKIKDQEYILENLFKHLKNFGTLYLGHSESILSLGNKMERIGQNIFVKMIG